MRRVIVLGTGTNVGKTYATAQMTSLLAGQSADGAVAALKPIETGVQIPFETDAAKLGQASQPRLPPNHAYAFESPISPHRAARLSGTQIKIEHVVEWISERAELIAKARSVQSKRFAEFILIETAGGVFSPINESQTNLDLALALEPSCWVLVGADRLGVLHDMRAALISMKYLARLPDIILLSAPSVPDESTGTNRQELETLGWAKILGYVAHNGGFDDSDQKNLLRALTQQSTANAVLG